MSSDQSTNSKTQDVSLPKSNATSIGWYFVKEFYTTLNKNPASMHNFYSDSSSCIYGNEGESVTPAVGDKEINDFFTSYGFKDCKVRLSNVDSIELDNGAILVQALGELANDGKDIKRFVQTFYLAQSQNVYYCKNDVLRFLREGYDDSSATSVDSWKEAEPATANPSSDDKATKEKTEPHTDKNITPVSEPVQKTAPASIINKDQSTPQTESPSSQNAPSVPQSKPKAPVSKQPTNTASSQQKPAPQAQESSKPQPSEEAQPSAPKNNQPSTPQSWANLAAVNHDKWGSAVSKVEGTVAAAQPAPYSQSANSNQSGGQRNANSSDKGKNSKKKENFPVYVKQVPTKVDVAALRSAFLKFGPIASVDILGMGNAVVDFLSQDTQKKALSERKLVLYPGSANTANVIIEERRNPVHRRDDYKNGRASNSGRNNNDYDRSGSGRGRTSTRPKPNVPK
ncbi:hypothetical protein BB561_003817 [Smittium simulii]|uniref:NTF2 domain-containing protein n=1 Tax=Smittium simulii TaxID=133385 RepID=A0A2T9YJC3_9FUNG|nr:hypothetical protein BB561_003817 [Smittium simulii]